MRFDLLIKGGEVIDPAAQGFNVRAAPGKQAKVVGCLAGGTVVRIDNGPVFIAPTSGGSPSTLDVWWHIGGRGWMVQQYLHG